MPATYYICETLPQKDVREMTVVTLDLGAYDQYRGRFPSLDCLAFYRENKQLAHLWFSVLNDFFAHLQRYLKNVCFQEANLCAGGMWSVIDRFFYSLMEFHEFVESKAPHAVFHIASDLNPLLGLVFRDLSESYDCECVLEGPSRLTCDNIAYTCSELNQKISAFLNIFGTRGGGSSGVLFDGLRPKDDLIEHFIKQNGRIHFLNPSPAILKKWLFSRKINYHFTSYHPPIRKLEFQDVPFTVGNADLTRSFGSFAKLFLDKYLSSHISEKQALKQWLLKVNPSLAIVGATQAASSRMLCDLCSELAIPSLHIPHGIYACHVSFPSIWGLDRTDGIIAYSKDIESSYKLHRPPPKKIIHGETGFWVSPRAGAMRSSSPSKTVLIMEYGVLNGFVGDSWYWYYKAVLDLMVAHYRRFSDRKMILRLKPFPLTAPYYRLRLADRGFWRQVKTLFFGDRGNAYQVMLESWLQKQKSLVKYLNRSLPSGSFEIDNQSPFPQVAEKSDYIIGQVTAAFLEAMKLKKPYYFYNAAAADYPPPFDSSKPYVFTDLDNLMDSLDCIPFEKFFECYSRNDSVELVYADIMRAGEIIRGAGEDIQLSA